MNGFSVSTLRHGANQDEVVELDANLLNAVMEFVNAPNWTASQQMLMSNELLQRPPAIAALDVLRKHAKDPETAQALLAHKTLLLRCYEVGAVKAFVEREMQPEKMVSALNDVLSHLPLENCREIVRSTPILLDPDIHRLLWALSDASEDPNWKIDYDVLGLLLARCADIGIDDAFDEFQQMAKADLEAAAADIGVSPALLESLKEFQRADTWGKAKRLLKNQPDLMNESLVRWLRATNDNPELSEAERDSLLLCAEVLDRCRRDGVDRTFSEMQLING